MFSNADGHRLLGVQCSLVLMIQLELFLTLSDDKLCRPEPMFSKRFNVPAQCFYKLNETFSTHDETQNRENCDKRQTFDDQHIGKSLPSYLSLELK